VLEHFSYYVRLQSALKEWHRVLQTSGVLRISVPDLDVLAHMFLQQNPKTGKREHRFNIAQRFEIMRMMFGGHTNEHDVNLVGLNEDSCAIISRTMDSREWIAWSNTACSKTQVK